MKGACCSFRWTLEADGIPGRGGEKGRNSFPPPAEQGVAPRPGPHSCFARHHAVVAAPAGELLRSAAAAEARMLFMVIERFKDRDPAPIYARLRERGRVLPEGLRYVESWVEANFDRCF